MSDGFPNELREEFLRDAKAARSAGEPRIAACYRALTDSVKDVSPALLTAAFELFDGVDVVNDEISQDVVIDASISEAIRRGQWLPASATEYLERFVALGSGAQPFRFEGEQ